MKRIAILGSTGSIGRSTLSIVEQYGDRFAVVALAAGNNVEAAVEQAVRWRPKVLSMATEEGAEKARRALVTAGAREVEVVSGVAGTVRVATLPEVDFVVSAIVGVAGLEATYEAVKAGKSVGLANKECLVTAGELLTEEARRQGKPLLPIDSEHNAVHQCMRGGKLEEVDRIWLTASGGPFLHTPAAEFESITVEQALNHPTWKMGKRITIDSATLMNKGFEVIEACWLFDLPPSQVDVVVHPQSSIHAMVEYNDGSILAQVSATDMRMPIQYAMTYPDRERAPVARMDWSEPRTWTFTAPDVQKFRLLKLAYLAQERGGSATCTLNAADEVAVEAFLAGRIPFPAIARTVEETLQRQPDAEPATIEEVIAVDLSSRETAARILREKG
jgi:1-deoxy-D-xylulose-5-phosphate reductoisomerase